jgi:hypothetical protein
LNTFFICGPHCSGKTSIIKRLKESGLISFAGGEIGKQFYYARKANGFDTAQQGVVFEHEIMQAELRRDKELLSGGGRSVVETWHPGNIAYVLERNPGEVRPMVEIIKKKSLQLKDHKVLGIRLMVSGENIYKRTLTFADRREWAVEYYSRISSNIDVALEMLGLTEYTVTVDANGSFAETLSRVSSIINKGA